VVTFKLYPNALAKVLSTGSTQRLNAVNTKKKHNGLSIEKNREQLNIKAHLYI
jgi:hypothetical protein